MLVPTYQLLLGVWDMQFRDDPMANLRALAIPRTKVKATYLHIDPSEYCTFSYTTPVDERNDNQKDIWRAGRSGGGREWMPERERLSSVPLIGS